MHNTYWYDGPKELGSVIAHQCGAVGLFSSKENPDFIISVSGSTHVILELFCHRWMQGELLETVVQGPSETYADYLHIWSLSGKDTVEGRKTIGREVLSHLRRILGITASLWGTLVGVRPTKLTHKLWDALGDLDQVRQELVTTHGINEAKWKLLQQVAVTERPYVEKVQQSPKEISLYSGIPFCETHCTYCSFPYGLIQHYGQVQDFVTTYHRDIEHMKRLVKSHGLEVQSLYMGGGTPTSLGDEDFHHIVQALGVDSYRP